MLFSAADLSFQEAFPPSCVITADVQRKCSHCCAYLHCPTFSLLSADNHSLPYYIIASFTMLSVCSLFIVHSVTQMTYLLGQKHSDENLTITLDKCQLSTHFNCSPLGNEMCCCCNKNIAVIAKATHLWFSDSISYFSISC